MPSLSRARPRATSAHLYQLYETTLNKFDYVLGKWLLSERGVYFISQLGHIFHYFEAFILLDTVGA